MNVHPSHVLEHEDTVKHIVACIRCAGTEFTPWKLICPCTGDPSEGLPDHEAARLAREQSDDPCPLSVAE